MGSESVGAPLVWAVIVAEEARREEEEEDEEEEEQGALQEQMWTDHPQNPPCVDFYSRWCCVRGWQEKIKRKGPVCDCIRTRCCRGETVAKAMEPTKRRRCLLFDDGFAPEGVEIGDAGAVASASPKKRGKGRRRSKSSMTVLKRAIAESDTPDTSTQESAGEAGSTAGGEKSMFQLFLESIESSEGTISDRLNKKHRHFDAALAEAWSSSLSKKQRRALAEADRRRIAEATRATRTLRHNFDANPDDHCETSAEAYADIVPMLKKYAAHIGKSPSELRIYDPYFCAGSVKKNLASLGFPNVYNENEDFYAQIANGTLPKYVLQFKIAHWPSIIAERLHSAVLCHGVYNEGFACLVRFDVLVTNPPYSKDHVLKLLDFAASQPQPHFLCMPSYVLVQPEYQCGLF